MPATRVDALLRDELAAAHVFAWGPAKKQRYSNRDPRAVARERLLALVPLQTLSKRELTSRAAKQAPPLSLKAAQSAMAALLREKHLREVKLIVGVEALPAPVPAQTSVNSVAEKIFAAVNRLAFGQGTTVTFYRLRQDPELASIPKQIFDEAALLLQSERRVLLSVHDQAAALAPEERDLLVTDGLGKFYVSAYVR
jgi:hypothetical protein